MNFVSISLATFFPSVSLTALRTDCHTRGCSPVPDPLDSHSWNMSRQACLTLWGLSARMESRTAAPTSRNTPISYHWAATLHTTSWLSSSSVGAERMGMREVFVAPNGNVRIEQTNINGLDHELCRCALC